MEKPDIGGLTGVVVLTRRSCGAMRHGVALVTALLLAGLCLTGPARAQGAPDVAEQRARTIVTGILQFYIASNPGNLTHKAVKDWTTADLKNLGRKDLDVLRSLVADERYDLTDALLPRNLARADFYRAILREAARRGIVQNGYVETLLATPAQRERQVTLRRTPFGIPNAVPLDVRESASTVVLRDAAVDMILNNPSALRVQKDWADQVAMAGTTALPLRTDVQAYDFGYTIGSLPRYARGDALNITSNSPLQPAEMQAKYCPVVHNIFRPGTAYLNRDNFLTGFVQARIDARTDFEPTTEHIGLFAECGAPAASSSPAAVAAAAGATAPPDDVAAGQSAYGTKDFATALRHFEAACSAGNPTGCYNLGVLYDRGEGVTESKPQAVRLFQLGCDRGNARACSQMSYMSSEGLGTAMDLQKGAALAKRACDGGQPSGCKLAIDIAKQISVAQSLRDSLLDLNNESIQRLTRALKYGDIALSDYQWWQDNKGRAEKAASNINTVVQENIFIRTFAARLGDIYRKAAGHACLKGCSN